MSRRTPKCILGVVVVAIFLTVTWSTTSARLSTTINNAGIEAESASLDSNSPSTSGVIVIDSAPNVSLEAVQDQVSLFGVSPLAKAAANLDQARNGTVASPTSPVDWVNGNAGASNSHYREGYSIPYRMVFTNLALGPHNVVIEWDIRHSGKNAIDYITHFNRLNNPNHQVVFGHPAETINPAIGIAGLGAPNTDTAIPAPPVSTNVGGFQQPTTSFGALPANERVFTIYNGTITGVPQYINNADGNLGDLSAAQSSTRLSINFNATSPTVVLAWGGHIGTQGDWGAGNSASAVSGSPYHTRLKELDGAGGNQDRSLSAGAVVVDCATCTVDAQPTQTVQCSTTNTHTSTINAGGVCDTPVHSWSITGNGTIDGPSNGASVNVIAGAVCNGSYTITDTVTCGGCTTGTTITCSKTVSVVDTTAPVISCPPNVNRECGASTLPAATGSATATDNCSTPTVGFTDSFAPGCGGTGVITRTWTATDGCSNTSSCVQTITIVDTTPPTITDVPDATVECNGSTDPSATGSATGSDSCGNVTISHTDGPMSDGCGNTGSFVRTWKATNSCGLMNTSEQTITIVDTTPPTITDVPDATVECTGSTDPAATGSATGSDTCGDVTISHSDGPMSDGCGNTGSFVRTWTATNACGLTNTSEQTINIVDTTRPTITDVPDTQVECVSGSIDPSVTGSATGSDTCGNVTISHSDGPTSDGCGNTGSFVRTWTATDDCGNTATSEQTITYVDTTDPIITCPADVAVTCLADVPPADFAGGSASDTCGNVTVTPSDVLDDPNSCGSSCGGKILRTYTATDECGNTASCTQIITYGTPGSVQDAQQLTIASLLKSGDLVVGSPGRSLTIPGGLNAKSSALCIVSRLSLSGSATSLPDFGDLRLDSATCQTSPPLDLEVDGTWKNALLSRAISLALNLRFDAQQQQLLKQQPEISSRGSGQRPGPGFELASFSLSSTLWSQGVLRGPDGVVGTRDDELDTSSARMQIMVPASVLVALGPNATPTDLLRLANAALAGQPTGNVGLADITAAVDAINRGFEFGRRRILVSASQR